MGKTASVEDEFATVLAMAIEADRGEDIPANVVIGEGDALYTKVLPSNTIRPKSIFIVIHEDGPATFYGYQAEGVPCPEPVTVDAITRRDGWRPRATSDPKPVEGAKKVSTDEWGLWSTAAPTPAAARVTSANEDHWGIGAAADLHDEPEAALPTTDGAEDDEARDAATASVLAAMSAVQTPAQPRTAKAKDPHAWLMAGNSGSGDVAAMAQAFLAKTGTKNFSAAERSQIIAEGEGTMAGNLSSLDLAGTHYQALADMTSVTDDEMGLF